jgi:hypothetical protein
MLPKTSAMYVCHCGLKGVQCFQGLKIDLMINASAQARSRGIDRFTYSKSAEQRLQMHGSGLSHFVHQNISSLLISLLPSFLMLVFFRNRGLYSDCVEGWKTN